jgi:diguanylate cyclase (GGDEF)-like protein/PAS domain S-box-containing protein
VNILLFFSASQSSNGLALATLSTAAAVLVLGLAVVARARGSLVSLLFFAITVAAAGWLAGFSAIYESEDSTHAIAWARVASAFASLIPAAIFHFTAVYVGRRQEMRGAILFCWIFCAVIAVVGATTSLFTVGLWHYSWGYYPRGSVWNIFYVAVFAGMLVASVRLLRRAARDVEGDSRKRARALMYAFIASSFALWDFLPIIGVGLHPLGFLAILGFTGIAANAMWRYQLAELTPEYAASQILATMKGAVIVADLTGKIRVINHGALALLGAREEDLLGKHIRTIIDPESTLSSAELLQSQGMLDQQMAWRTASGAQVDVLASSSYVRDSEGAPVGVVYVAADVTERRRAEQALRESEHRYRTLFDGNPLPMWVYDYETLRFIAVNEAASHHYGFSKTEFLNMTIADIRPLEELPLMRDALANLKDRNRGGIFGHRKKDGTLFDAEITSFEFVSAGRRSRLVIAVDVTERERAEQRLRDSEERYRLLFERNLAGVFRTTLDGRFLDVNDALARIFGFESRRELLAQSAYSVYFSREERQRLISRLREQKALSNVEVRMRRRDGTAVWVLENMTLLDGVEGGVIEGTIIDITERKSAQEQMEYQAYHDVLTGLPNRLLFRDRISVALAHARRNRRYVAVMFLDLDQFKLVNDTLGHTVGDGLLQSAAERLVDCVRGDDTVARMGGDEFTILLSDLPDGRAAATVAQKVLESVSEPIVVESHELFITTSIGIAIYPEDGADAETLLRHADRAMYRAKEAGRNNYQFAMRATIDATAGRLSIERSLHHAFERKEFVVHYQPMVEIGTRRVVGAEALIRWNHPEYGLMTPDDFIPIAEESGLIYPIGEWVMRTACKQMKRWHDAGHDDLRIAVNLSARQFQQRGLTGMIEHVLIDTGYPAASLEVEITESIAMHNAELSLAIMRRLKEMGISISIDDFGTGYSSLSYLKRFPIDTVKIDQNFIRDLSRDSNDGAIISAVISMARALKLRVVAEGVETEEQLAFLRRQHCEVIQGFLCSRPVPAEEFEVALATR